MNDRLLAEYMVGKCRQGFDYISMYLSATLFERLMVSKLKKKNPQKCEEIKKERTKGLDNIIKAICTQMGANKDYSVDASGQMRLDEVFRFADFFSTGNRRIVTIWDAKDKLYSLKEVRNSIIHSENPEKLLEDKEGEIIDLLLYVSSEYAPGLFREKLYTKINTRSMAGLRDVLCGKEADYLVRSVDEVMIKRFDLPQGLNRKSWKLTCSDLNNLFIAREKLVTLKNTLDSWLEKNNPNFTTTILTTIDTASAYVWLPIVSFNNSKKDEDRPNLTTLTISILITPLDVRVYIDFGGLCFAERGKYYDFISSPDGDFKEFLIRLRGAERDNFYAFDVEWYSFIGKRLSVDKILDDWPSWEALVHNTKRELGAISQEIIVSSNRLLTGFVFGHKWIEDNGPLKESFFTEKLGLLLSLYGPLLLEG